MKNGRKNRLSFKINKHLSILMLLTYYLFPIFPFLFDSLFEFSLQSMSLCSLEKFYNFQVKFFDILITLYALMIRLKSQKRPLDQLNFPLKIRSKF
jgi:hypothetical protein